MKYIDNIISCYILCFIYWSLKPILLEALLEEAVGLGNLLLLESLFGVVEHVLYVGAFACIFKV